MTPLYIFDLDGRLALIEHRRHLVDGRCHHCKGTGCEAVPTIGPNAGVAVVCRSCSGTCAGESDGPAFFAACIHDTPNWPVISTMMALLKAGADVRI